MTDRNWFTALTGLLFVLIVIVGFALAGDQPDPTDKPIQEVLDFYKDDRDTQWVSVFLEAFAAAVLVVFGAHLRHALDAAKTLSPVILAGTVIFAVGLAIDATITVALLEAADSKRINAETVQTLSLLYANDFVPFAVGIILIASSSGLAVIRHGVLPKWLGWIALVLAVVALTPAGFLAFLGMGIWIAVASILLAIKARGATTAQSPPTYGV